MKLVLCALTVTAFVAIAEAGPTCTSDSRPSWWCSQRITQDSTKCSTDDVFKWQLCCKSCEDFYGGSNQAGKETNYQQTSSPCQDNANAAAYCAALVAGTNGRTCATAGNDAYIYCKASCQQCSGASTNQYTTRAACVATDACYNNTYCNRNGQTGAGTCTNDGLTASTAEVGTCDCSSCLSKSNAACKTDADCAGSLGTITGDCQRTAGLCTDTTCTEGNSCLNDYECGGYAGTCMSVKTYTDGATEYLRCTGSTLSARQGLSCTCVGCPSLLR